MRLVPLLPSSSVSCVFTHSHNMTLSFVNLLSFNVIWMHFHRYFPMWLPSTSWCNYRRMKSCTSCRVHTNRIVLKITHRCFIRRSSHGIYDLVTCVSTYNISQYTPTLYILCLYATYANTHPHCIFHSYHKYWGVYRQREGHYYRIMALHATLLGGAEHAAQVMQICHDVLGENGFGREWCWRVGFGASCVLDELGCWQVNIPVFCSMYFLLHQSIQHFTELGCVGRAKNPDAWGAGRIMQLGSDRGKIFFM